MAKGTLDHHQEPSLGLWWEEAFPAVSYESSPPGKHKMLILIAYDIAKPRRLARVAKICEDYGIRVQYSVFECHLEESLFEQLWYLLMEVIDEQDDRIVAYRLDSRSAGKTLTAGNMVCTQQVVCYLV